jgi:hypothetical protein
MIAYKQINLKNLKHFDYAFIKNLKNINFDPKSNSG